jgi:hypothetical protein
MLLDLRASGFNQSAVLDSRRAGRFARPAVQAAVDVSDESLTEFEFPLVD